MTLGEGRKQVLLIVAVVLYGLSLVERSNQVGLGGMIAHFGTGGRPVEDDSKTIEAEPPSTKSG